MLKYNTERLTEGNKIVSHEFGADLAKARAHARRTSRNLDDLVYIVASIDDERVGQEVYYQGRRDSVEGRII